MPFCPVCKAEYVAGINRCADCDVELVEKLPPEEEYEFEVLCDAQGQIDSRIIQAALDEEGIPSILSGDALDTVVIYPAQDTKIWVPRQFLQQAQEVLKALAAEPSTEELERLAGQEMIYCDECGAQVPADAVVCPECGARFENTEPVEEPED